MSNDWKIYLLNTKKKSNPEKSISFLYVVDETFHAYFLQVFGDDIDFDAEIPTLWILYRHVSEVYLLFCRRIQIN